MTMRQQRGFAVTGCAERLPCAEVPLNLKTGVQRDGDETRLVELRLSNGQDAGGRIVVTERESHDLPPAQTGRGQDDHSQTSDLSVQGRALMRL
jgi:hypothetical protein